MRIYLPKFYQNTKGIRIQSGYYNIDDKALGGYGNYLVNTGHAILIDDVVHKAVTTETITDDSTRIESDTAETVSYTSGAQQFIEDRNLDLGELSAHFLSIGKTRVSLTDMKTYVGDE